MTIHLERAQRRRIKRLCDRVDREVLPADRKFFERFSHRSYRIRVASRLEIEANGIVDPTWPDIPEGYAVYCAVRQLAPGVRVRAFFVARAGNDTDLSDAAARQIYDQAARMAPGLREVERNLLKVTQGGPAA